MKHTKQSTKVFKFILKKDNDIERSYFTEAYDESSAKNTLANKLNVQASELYLQRATLEELTKCWSDKSKKCYAVTANETMNTESLIRSRTKEIAVKEMRKLFCPQLRKQFLSAANDNIREDYRTIHAPMSASFACEKGWILTPIYTHENKSIFRFQSLKDAIEYVRNAVISAGINNDPFDYDLTYGEALDYLLLANATNKTVK